jgi:NAD-dependent SIR2 family protein deacetylase
MDNMDPDEVSCIACGEEQEMQEVKRLVLSDQVPKCQKCGGTFIPRNTVHPHFSWLKKRIFTPLIMRFHHHICASNSDGQI